MADEEKKEGKRVFAGRAFLQILEKGLYGVFREVIVEEKDPRTGQMVREKLGRSIGPLRLLREMRAGEEQEVKMRTIHPDTQKEIQLVEYRDGDKL